MRMDRIRDMRSRSMRMRDGRNPYGSRGGYVVSDKRGRDYGRMDDYGRTSEYRTEYPDMAYSRSRMERDRDYGERDYERNRDYGNDIRRVGNFEYDTYYSDGRDYASGEYKLSSRELKEWARDLLDEVKPEHRQSFEKENFERKAREMGIEPREYSMEELYLVTLIMETDHAKTLTKYGINNIDTAICLAKDWLEDDDVDMRYGEKLGAYYFNVVCVE